MVNGIEMAMGAAPTVMEMGRVTVRAVVSFWERNIYAGEEVICGERASANGVVASGRDAGRFSADWTVTGMGKGWGRRLGEGSSGESEDVERNLNKTKNNL
jgi:hypothetical protein